MLLAMWINDSINPKCSFLIRHNSVTAAYNSLRVVVQLFSFILSMECLRELLLYTVSPQKVEQHIFLSSSIYVIYSENIPV